MNLPFITGYYEDPRSGQYEDVSAAYAHMWAGHRPDMAHYVETRTALLKWLLMSEEAGIEPKDSSAILAGPGFSVTNQRELAPEIIKAYFSDVQRLLVVDFSREILLDAERSLLACSKRLEDTIRLVRRDVSRGLSAQFDAIIQGHLDDVRFPEDFLAFMEWLQNFDIGNLTSNTGEPSQTIHEGELGVRGIDGSQGMAFQNIVRDVAPVRLIISNLFLTGMFATTEADVRSRLMDMATGDPQSFTPATVAWCLMTWHDLISELNTAVALQYFKDATQAHPGANHFVSVDVTSKYDELLGEYARIDMTRVKNEMLSHDLVFRNIHSWELDDDKETPPHRHDVTAYLASSPDSPLLKKYGEVRSSKKQV